MSRLSNEDYEQTLQTSVVFLELFSAAAVNIFSECIARNTPILVNRCPGTLEYLGPDYPLIYDCLSRLHLLLASNCICQAHDYLTSFDKSGLEFSFFSSEINKIVEDLNL